MSLYALLVYILIDMGGKDMRKFKLWLPIMLSVSLASTGLCGCSKIAEKFDKSETVEEDSDEDSEDSDDEDEEDEEEETKKSSKKDKNKDKDKDKKKSNKKDSEDDEEEEEETKKSSKKDKDTDKGKDKKKEDNNGKYVLDDMSSEEIYDLLTEYQSSGKVEQWCGYEAKIPKDFYYFMNLDNLSTSMPMSFDIFLTFGGDEIDYDDLADLDKEDLAVLVTMTIDAGEDLEKAVEEGEFDTEDLLEEVKDTFADEDADVDSKEFNDTDWIMISGNNGENEQLIGVSVSGSYMSYIILVGNEKCTYDLEDAFETVAGDFKPNGRASEHDCFGKHVDGINDILGGSGLPFVSAYDDLEDETEEETKGSKKTSVKKYTEASIPSQNNMRFTFNDQKVEVGKTTLGELEEILGEKAVLDYDGNHIKFYIFGTDDTNEVEVEVYGDDEEQVIYDISIDFPDYKEQVYSIKEFNGDVTLDDIIDIFGVKPEDDDSELGIASWTVSNGNAELTVFYDADSDEKYIDYVEWDAKQ